MEIRKRRRRSEKLLSLLKQQRAGHYSVRYEKGDYGIFSGAASGGQSMDVPPLASFTSPKKRFLSLNAVEGARRNARINPAAQALRLSKPAQSAATPAASRKRHRLLALLVLFVVLLAALYYMLNQYITPGLYLYAETRVQALATDAIYAAILTATDGVATEDYVTVMRSEDQVYYIEMNNRALNRLAAQCSTDVQNWLYDVGEQGITIPLGTASGIPLLSGGGPNVHVTFAPEGTAQVDFSSEFHDAGINQTMHRVHMQVRTDIALVLPGLTRNITTKVDMTVAEHIIVGRVPNAYAGSESAGELNLVPAE